MTRSIARVALLLLALALVTAACGDDDGGGPFSSTTEEGATTQAGGSTSAGGESTTTAGEETNTSATAGSGEIDELLAQYRETPLRTTYLLGEDRQEITFSQDPTQDPPVSAAVFEGGSYLTIGDESIICSGEGEAAQCFSMPGEDLDMASAFLGPYASLALSLQGMTDTPGVEVDSEQVTIAGRTGVCFTYTPTTAVAGAYEFVRSCIDQELGFTLLVEVQQPGADEPETVMELVSFGDPEPGDFEPSGPVVPLPEG